MSFNLPKVDESESYKEFYEGHLGTNTYGIEIEFATHSDFRLSFSHVTVCSVVVGGQCEWHFETDADNTLELVSPILEFDDQETARLFKDVLLWRLFKKVEAGTTLAELAEWIGRRVVNNFDVQGPNRCKFRWTEAPQGSEDHEPTIQWISCDELIDEINARNADVDVDVERGVAAREALSRWRDRGVGDRDARLSTVLGEVLLTKPRKHGGLPSSQMNIPLPLKRYVPYMTQAKREAAWARLLEGRPDGDGGTWLPTEDKTWQDQKITTLDRQYRGAIERALPSDRDENLENAWKLKHLHTDHIDSVKDEKTPFWHRYWLWYETFCVCADRVCNAQNSDPQKENIEALVQKSPRDFWDWDELALEVHELHHGVDPSSERAPRFHLTYLFLQKMVFGALAELSESKQLALQERLMQLGGELRPEAIRAAMPDTEFIHFHYALKDLTALWFKAPLVDVLNEEGAGEDWVRDLRKRTTPTEIASLLASVFGTRLRLLGWYYGIRKSLNRGFEYDWDDFVRYNMPNLARFQAEVERVTTEAVADGAFDRFICRSGDGEELGFLERESRRGNARIAPWEGRWDTLKRALGGKYLVEHRNN